MHRLRTVTYLDVSAVEGHHAMPAALLFKLGKDKAANGEGWALPFISCAQDIVDL